MEQTKFEGKPTPVNEWQFQLLERFFHRRHKSIDRVKQQYLYTKPSLFSTDFWLEQLTSLHESYVSITADGPFLVSRSGLTHLRQTDNYGSFWHLTKAAASIMGEEFLQGKETSRMDCLVNQQAIMREVAENSKNYPNILCERPGIIRINHAPTTVALPDAVLVTKNRRQPTVEGFYDFLPGPRDDYQKMVERLDDLTATPESRQFLVNALSKIVPGYRPQMVVIPEYIPRKLVIARRRLENSDQREEGEKAAKRNYDRIHAINFDRLDDLTLLCMRRLAGFQHEGWHKYFVVKSQPQTDQIHPTLAS
jgi:hypothetical protein